MNNPYRHFDFDEALECTSNKNKLQRNLKLWEKESKKCNMNKMNTNLTDKKNRDINIAKKKSRPSTFLGSEGQKGFFTAVHLSLIHI